tara:strand:- start:34 stop:252 length:219 start_codon:yes stop_codon:yes gene_type:complete
VEGRDLMIGFNRDLIRGYQTYLKIKYGVPLIQKNGRATARFLVGVCDLSVGMTGLADTAFDLILVCHPERRA